MPLWTTDTPEVLASSVPVEVITGIVMTDGQETAAVALPPNPDHRVIDLAFFIKFASNPPSTVDYQMQLAFNNIDAEFFLVGTAMTNSETVGGLVIVPAMVGRFARVIATDADTVAPTISIMCM